MKTLNVLFWFSYFINVYGQLNITVPQFRSDYVYNIRTQIWFKLHLELLDTPSAKIKCGHEGANRVLGLTPEVLNTLGAYQNNTRLADSDVMGMRGADMGALPPELLNKLEASQNSTEESAYMNVTGSVKLMRETLLKIISITDWNAQPSACFRSTNESFLWDGNCHEKHPFMCARAPLTTDKFNDCGTIDNRYEPQWPAVSPQHCHKYHWEYATWPEAQDICRAEGGYLTVINSIDEALRVNETFTFYRPLFNVTEAVWIGYREWAPGDWWTVHGQSLEEAGFREWCNGCPATLQKEASAALFCGAFANGWLEDAPCKDRRNFICEKRADSLTDRSRPYLY